MCGPWERIQELYADLHAPSHSLFYLDTGAHSVAQVGLGLDSLILEILSNEVRIIEENAKLRFFLFDPF